MSVLDSFYSGGGGPKDEPGTNEGASGRGRYHQGQPGGGRPVPWPFRRRWHSSEPEERRHRVVIFPGFSVPHLHCYPRRTSPDRSEPALLAIFNDTVTRWVVDNGYIAVFLLMVLESACVPIPSEVTMLVGGALASPAFAGPGQELDLGLVILAGTAGNLVGSWLAYTAGAVGGRPLLDRFGRYLLIRPHEVDRAHDWFERHGEAAVFFGRLLPVIRTFISLPAGIARMRPVKFTAYTLLGCLPFVSLIAWLGYRAGANWVKVEQVLQPFSWLILAAVLVLGVAYVARRWRTVRAEYAALDTLRRQVESQPAARVAEERPTRPTR
jgi:membrane protein DedA with SNARE-associated domain